MTGELSMVACKRRLAALWLVAGCVLFLLLVFQTVLGSYEKNAGDAWGWLLPNIMPTLSLIISVLVLDQLGQGVRTDKADRFLFYVAFGLSCAYLFTVLLTILVEPFSNLTPLELMRQSNLWLAPLQGLTVASLGAFFIKA